MARSRTATLLCGLSVLALLLSPAARADEGGIIRDSEIEGIVKQLGRPVFIAAGLRPDDITIALVENQQINAFVAGGMNIFLHTGLILACDNANQLTGVIAHETGHIAGGHLARSDAGLEAASIEAILAAVVGAAAAVASHGDQSGNAAGIPGALAGAQEIGMRSIMAFTRTQESSADQGGITFLERAGITPRGLMQFLEKLSAQELLPASRQDEYLRTHPLTRDRIEAVRVAVDKAEVRVANGAATPGTAANQPAFTVSNAGADGIGPIRSAGVRVDPAASAAGNGGDYSFQHEPQFEHMKAKLIGYLQPSVALRKYKADDKSEDARYARSIALFRMGELDPALKLMDGLIAGAPSNPWYYEMRAQMLFENSRVKEAAEYYLKTLAYVPHDGLVETEAAHAILESTPEGSPGQSVQLAKVVQLLTDAARNEGHNPLLHRLLATAYGRRGDQSNARLELAEEALLEARYRTARHEADAVMKSTPAGSRAWLRAQDIVSTSEPLMKHAKDADEDGGRQRRGLDADGKSSRFGSTRSGDAPANGSHLEGSNWSVDVRSGTTGPFGSSFGGSGSGFSTPSAPDRTRTLADPWNKTP